MTVLKPGDYAPITHDCTTEFGTDCDGTPTCASPQHISGCDAARADETRCPYVNAHYLTNRAQVRDDGWRCGKDAGHVNGHYLYSSDGETVLDAMGPWVLPSEHVVVTPPTPPATKEGQ